MAKSDIWHDGLVTERYPLWNSTEREAKRLALLQGLSDPITIRWFDELGVTAGWQCAELGAGGGSVVEWLADRVGPSGSVTAVDRDTSQLESLAAAQSNVRVLQGDLCQLDLPRNSLDLVHSRSVLMHLKCPDRVVEGAAAALRPGGLVFFEETDGAPAQCLTDPPECFARVMVPLAARWTWARGLAGFLESLGMVEVRQDVREDPVVGASPQAEFWKFTLGSVLELRRQQGADDPEFDDSVAQMTALLDDPTFRAPFSARHRVTARRPA